MKKIPTLFVRNPDDRAHVIDEVTEGCDWVLAGEGVARRKLDGVCMAKHPGHGWLARREVKPGKTEPANFIEVHHDHLTDKRTGWVPAAQSPFVSFWREATARHPLFLFGTYELIGPKINGNPEASYSHTLVLHRNTQTIVFPALTFAGLRDTFHDGLAPVRPRWEGVVWHHPDGRMAKLKVRDFQQVVSA